MKFITLKDVKLEENILSQIGEFTYLRTYSRKLHDEKRRERWEETVLRVVNYNLTLEYNHMIKNKLVPDVEEMKREAVRMFYNIYQTKQFPSGRTLWVGGTDIAEQYPISNFNCAFTHVKSYNDLCEVFYVLLLGTGVGIKHILGEDEIEPMKKGIKVEHSDYHPVKKHERLEQSKLVDMENGYVKLYVGDSKEGWVEALRYFFEVHSAEKYKDVHTLVINYNSVRPKGEELKRFGGTASGHDSIKDMFTNISRVFNEEVDKTLTPMDTIDKYDGIIYGRLRPIHILDIANFIGHNVVVGGVRRTAEIFMFAPHDFESLFAKAGLNGIWSEEQRAHMKRIVVDACKLGIKVPQALINQLDGDLGVMRDDLVHRRMSNNSVCFTEKPSEELMKLFVDMMRYEGEPGLINLEAANKRRPNAEGLNPCAEILLDSKGVCNLTTINMMQFVVPDPDGEGYTLDMVELVEAQRMSVRIGLRMTLPKLEIESWDVINKRDTLVGCSLTGWKDAFAICEFTEAEERQVLAILRDYAHGEAQQFAHKLRVPAPLLVTTVKPEGTLSIVAGAVSPGIHWSHSEYYIRRIRINSDTALAKAVRTMGWSIHPEVGQGDDLDKATTWVVEFPVYSGAKKTKDDLTIEEQFDNYLMFQTYYTDHNTSNTMTVKPDEWDKLPKLILDNWDNYVGVSFLSHDGGTYPLMPYEAITKEKYEEMKEAIPVFDRKTFEFFEGLEYMADETEGIESCATGACSFR